MENKEPVTATLSDRVAEEVRAMLARRRVSGRKLADQLGVSPSWVSYRLTGTQPIDLNDLERIASALNVEVTDLLPRSSEGRVVASSSATNQRSGHKAGRLRQSSSRTITKRHVAPAHPIGRPETSSHTTIPTGPPTQRRATLIAHRPGN